jgi:N-acetylglucosaminyl-diphospho-decaprenol L-rhamnosyltransferase
LQYSRSTNEARFGQLAGDPAGVRSSRAKGPRRPLRLSSDVDDIAIITVSTNEAHWLRPCLSTVFAHIGDVSADVVVVDNDSRDGTAEVVATEFPEARVVPSRNHGFSHANNRGLMTCDARYVLFLNPDTEILEGSFEELVRAMDARPTVGLVGVRQVTPDGRLDATIRHFPNALRALGDALAAERLPWRPGWLGERELDRSVYDREVACEWTSGSFMLVRREAIESAGFLDERYFMYSDETDFCRRIKSAGWEIRHLPSMTILHHDGKAGIKPSIESLGASSRMRYARKHFSPAHRLLYFGALVLGASVRSVYGGSGERGRLMQVANRRKLATLLGRSQAPFGPPSRYSVRIAGPDQRRAGRKALPASDART